MKSTKKIIIENLTTSAITNINKNPEYYKKRNIKIGDSIKYFKNQLTTTNKTDNYLNDWTKIRERIDNAISNKEKEDINKIINNSKDTVLSFMDGIKNKIIPMSLVKQMLILSNKDKKLTINSKGKNLTITFKDKKKDEKFTNEEIDTIKTVLLSQNFFYPIEISKPNFDIDKYLLYTSIGMDTNGRKNRSGTNYENKIKSALETYCKKNNLEYTFHFNGEFKEKYPKKYKEIVEKIKGVKKIPDFLIFGATTTYLIETNYSDGGSKLQETIKAYIDLQKRVNEYDDLEFIYITDGKQWTGNTSHLNDAWNKIKYIINYNMIIDNILDYIIENNK